MAGKSIDKQFFKYVLASMITMFLQGVYGIVDGLFVSNRIGYSGLSAINVVWPLLAFITATGTGIGCGGSVIMSTMQGAGKPKESKEARMHVLLLLGVGSLIITVLFYAVLPHFLSAMGTEGITQEYAMTYGKIMILGSVLQIFSTGLTPLLRNDNHTVLAMNIMVTGMLCNLVLNYVFLYQLSWGIRGSATASLISQGLTVVVCTISLLKGNGKKIKRKELFPDKNLVLKILKTGISPFGISLTPSLILMYHNIQCIRYGADIGIGIFSLITSTIGSYRILLIGIADGIQPLASYAKGAGDYKAMRKIRNKGIITAIVASLCLFLFTIITARFYAKIFGYTGEMAEKSAKAILLSATQLLFTGLVRVSNSFFYAVGKNKYSLFLIYFDPLCMTPLLIIVLPIVFGLTGIWVEMTISQMVLNVVAFFMYYKQEKEIKLLEQLK